MCCTCTVCLSWFVCCCFPLWFRDVDLGVCFSCIVILLSVTLVFVRFSCFVLLSSACLSICGIICCFFACRMIVLSVWCFSPVVGLCCLLFACYLLVACLFCHICFYLHKAVVLVGCWFVFCLCFFCIFSFAFSCRVGCSHLVCQTLFVVLVSVALLDVICGFPFARLVSGYARFCLCFCFWSLVSRVRLPEK